LPTHADEGYQQFPGMRGTLTKNRQFLRKMVIKGGGGREKGEIDMEANCGERVMKKQEMRRKRQRERNEKDSKKKREIERENKGKESEREEWREREEGGKEEVER
jgi:hypothetical protein